MALWTKFKELVDRLAGDERPARILREEELRLALRRCSYARR
jgi:hypothetical protein